MLSFGGSSEWAAENRDALAPVLTDATAARSARLAARILLTLGEFGDADGRPEKAVIALINGINGGTHGKN